jgi:quinol monooxygenase YgiN
MFGLAISLAAQTVGHAIGFGPVAFRGMEIGAGIIASLALAIGLTEVAGRRVPARFATRLVLPAIAFVSLVILGSDPLSVTSFSKAWPDPVLHYQIIPNQLLKYLLAPVTVLVALTALGCTAVRSQRERVWRDAVPPVTAAAAAALALSVPGLAVLAGGNTTASLHVGALFALLCAAAVALTWFASARISRVRLQQLRQDAVGQAETDEWALQHSWAGGPEESGEFEPLGGDRDPYGSLYRHHDDHPDYGAAAYAGLDAESGGYAANGAPHGPEPGHDDTGYRDADPLSGGWRGGDAGDGHPAQDRFGYQGSAADDGGAGARLFGQIAIYTLLEDRVADFDRLTRHVVKQVRANEPDTLVFIVHAVPSAPMQRILYEVYRDRGAYEEHKRQPYVAGFESDRRPYVLATNVIELGLQQAKVSPLPSISDLLSDTGYDLLNDTGFGQPGFAPRSAGRPGAGGDRAGGGAAAGGAAGSGQDGGGPAGGLPGAHRPR